MHKLCGLKQQKFIVLTVQLAGNPKLRSQQDHAPCETWRQEFPPASSSFWWLTSVVPWLITPLSVSLITWPFLCDLSSHKDIVPLLKRTLVILD